MNAKRLISVLLTIILVTAVFVPTGLAEGEGQPSSLPVEQPSSLPSEQPSSLPSEQPSSLPSEQPGDQEDSTAYFAVEFRDWEGTLIEPAQQIAQGEDAVEPVHPNREGYEADGWDVSFTNVQSDLVVTAQYKLVTSQNELGAGVGPMSFLAAPVPPPPPSNNTVNLYIYVGNPQQDPPLLIHYTLTDITDAELPSLTGNWSTFFTNLNNATSVNLSAYIGLSASQYFANGNISLTDLGSDVYQVKVYLKSGSIDTTYTVNYTDEDGDTVYPSVVKNGKVGNTVTESAPAKTGYVTPANKSLKLQMTGNVITFVYNLVDYNITYVLNGGTNNADNPSTYTVKSNITLKDPTKPGYSFLGWTPGNSIPTGSTGNKTFTATWSSAIAYDITYVLNGGTNNVDNPSTYTVASPTITLKDPTRPGYTFLGWTPGNSIPTGSTGNKTFTATWSSAITYDITYVLNGGTNNVDNPSTYTVESPTITLKDPTRPGYTFLGWTPGNSIPTGSTGNKTFTATWSSAIAYNISYVLNGGTNNADNPSTYTVESPTITLKDPTRPGYTFLGWTPGSSIPAGSTGDKTFTATWEVTEYNITYVLNGGTNNVDNPSTYTVVSPTITLKNPTRPGYTFLGWTPGSSIPAGSTGDKAFTATWEVIDYNITYVLNGGTNNVDNPSTYTVESDITLKDPTRPGYTFLGWTPGNSIPTGSTGDKTFTATWSDAIVYNITYVLNGGTNDADNPSTYTVESDTITLKDPARPGYTFLGWTPGSSIPAGSTGDKTFTATWEVIDYNITYVLNGGTNNVDNPSTYTVESDITLKDPTRPGYDFLGWTPGNSITSGSTGDKTFTATWSSAIVYNISYVLNGGVNHADNPTTYTVESDTITLKDPTRPGYDFLGWTPGNSITSGSTGDKTFTATWSSAIAYDITYVLNGGVNHADNPATYTVESDTITLKDPTRPGYTFLGWTPGSSIPAGSTGDKTFTATWEVIDYNITYVLNGGTNNVDNPSTYTVESEDITLKDPTRPGYDFLGWTPGNSITSGSTGDKTFTATWSSAIVYNISYVLNGGVNHADNPTTYTVESDTITLKDPTRPGYTFLGWTPGSSILAGSTGDKAFTATWEVIDYNITYVLNGGTNNVDNPSTYTVESDITLKDPTRPGYNFLGWTPGSSIPVGSTGDKTFTAMWSDAIEYNITYVLNGGVNHADNPAKYTVESDTITLKDPTRPGYDFLGWAPGSSITAGSTGDKTFTATWSSAIVYNISYVLNGGIVSGTNPSTYTVESDDITLINPALEGYTFTGWSGTDLASPAMTVTIPAGSTGDRAYTANFIQKTYTVRFFAANGTTQIGTSQTINWGGSATLETAPALVGLTFAGWVLTGDDATVVTSLQSIKENIDAVASYDPILYTVTFVDFNGNELGTDTVRYGTGAVAPADPTREGYRFTGWDVPFDNVTDDLTVTALYAINTYTVTFVDFNGNVLSEQTVNWNTAAMAPADPARDGYTFAGWDVPFDHVTSDLTVTATYQEVVQQGDEDVPQTGDNGTPTVEEEPIPASGPQQNLNWMWWLLLIPLLLLLLLLLLLYNVSVMVYGRDDKGQEKLLRTIRRLKSKKDEVIVSLKEKHTVGGIDGMLELTKSFTKRMRGHRLTIEVEGANVLSVVIPDDADEKFKARIEKWSVQ